MVAKVLWRDAQGIEGAIELGAGEIKIGRAMDCAIRTDDAMVSRHHARLLWGGGGYVLEDLGSANGVYYQEQRVQSHMFKHGDAVRCGSLWLRYVDTAQLGQPVAEQAPPPQPMMQHPGAGAVGAHGPTGHAMNAVSPQQLAAVGAQPVPPPQAPPPQAPGLQQDAVVAPFGQMQRRGEAGKAAADHANVAVRVAGERGARMIALGRCRVVGVGVPRGHGVSVLRNQSVRLLAGISKTSASARPWSSAAASRSLRRRSPQAGSRARKSRSKARLDGAVGRSSRMKGP